MSSPPNCDPGTQSRIGNARYLRELLASAETEADIDAAVALLDEVESQAFGDSEPDESRNRWCAETLPRWRNSSDWRCPP